MSASTSLGASTSPINLDLDVPVAVLDRLADLSTCMGAFQTFEAQTFLEGETTMFNHMTNPKDAMEEYTTNFGELPTI